MASFLLFKGIQREITGDPKALIEVASFRIVAEELKEGEPENMSRFHHRSKSSIFLAGLILLTVTCVVNLGYDSDLSDDHPTLVGTTFSPLIHFDDAYDAVMFGKFIGEAIILPFTEKQSFLSRAPPAEMKKTVLQVHQYSLPGLTFFIVAILNIVPGDIHVFTNQNYSGTLLGKNRKMPKYLITHPRIDCKETQINRLKIQGSRWEEQGSDIGFS
jgi:hypothetical protein